MGYKNKLDGKSRLVIVGEQLQWPQLDHSKKIANCSQSTSRKNLKTHLRYAKSLIQKLEVTWHIYVCEMPHGGLRRKMAKSWVFEVFLCFWVVPELQTTLETQNSGFLLSRVAIAWITVKLWISPKLTKFDVFTENSGFSLTKLNFSTDFVKNPCRRP